MKHFFYKRDKMFAYSMNFQSARTYEIREAIDRSAAKSGGADQASGCVKGWHKVVVAAESANRYLPTGMYLMRFVYATSGRPLKYRHDGWFAHVSAAIRCITGRYVTSIPHGFLPSAIYSLSEQSNRRVASGSRERTCHVVSLFNNCPSRTSFGSMNRPSKIPSLGCQP